jgi:hypothetical protein
LCSRAIKDIKLYTAVDDNWTRHMFQSVEAEEERVDDRSVDDLLSFINGGNGGIHECLSTVRCMLSSWVHFGISAQLFGIISTA